VKCEKLFEKDMMIDANAAITLLERRPDQEQIFRLCKIEGNSKLQTLYLQKGLSFFKYLLTF